ncbi:MAG: membrane protein insertion efficiency factor YidD [Burkholderiaceae bacterium]
MSRLLIALVQTYRLIISPWLPPRCRFVPTCSEYAIEALQRHGAWRGGWLALRRVSRCHPFGGSGIDEVPTQWPVRKPR